MVCGQQLQCSAPIRHAKRNKNYARHYESSTDKTTKMHKIGDKHDNIQKAILDLKDVHQFLFPEAKHASYLQIVAF